MSTDANHRARAGSVPGASCATALVVEVKDRYAVLRLYAGENLSSFTLFAGVSPAADPSTGIYAPTLHRKCGSDDVSVYSADNPRPSASL